MSLILDGSTQYGTLPAEVIFSSAATYTIVTYSKSDTSVSVEGFQAGMTGNAVNTRYSGVIFRGDQTPKSLAKVKSSTVVNYGSPVANFVPSGGWDIFITSRNVTGTTAGSARAMLNAGAVDITSQGELSNTDLNVFSIGARKNGSGAGGAWTSFWKGKIYGVAVWNRQLTVGEENSIKAGDLPTTIPSGLVSWISFSGAGTATTVNDNTGRVMTFVGAPQLDGDSPFASITSIGTAGVVQMDDGTSTVTNPITTSGLGLLTSLTLTTVGHGSKQAVSLAGTAGNQTFIFPKWADGEEFPRLGTVTASAVGATGSATTSATLANVTNFLDETFNSIVTVDNTYLGYWLANAPISKPLQEGEFVYYPDLNDLIIHPDSGVEVSDPITSGMNVIAYIHRGPSSPNDKFIEAYQLVINEVGGLVDVTQLSLNDAIHYQLSSYGSYSLNGLRMAWMKANGGSGLDYASVVKSFLVSKGINSLSITDGWAAYLKAKGYSGSVMDMEKEFWIDGGVA